MIGKFKLLKTSLMMFILRILSDSVVVDREGIDVLKCVDFYQPWFEVVFNEYIVPIHLEAVLVVDND